MSSEDTAHDLSSLMNNMSGAETPAGQVALAWRKMSLEQPIEEAFEKYSTPRFVSHAFDHTGRPGPASDMQRQIAEFHNLKGVKISEEILAVKTFDDLVLTHSKMTTGDQTFFQTTMQRVVDGKIVEHWPWTVLGLDVMK